MANQKLLGLVRGIPNTHSPIIGTSEEDRVISGMPERIAAHPVDGTLMSIVTGHVLVRVRHRALVNGAIFSCGKVNCTLLGLREIDSHTTSLDESHALLLVFLFSISRLKYVFLVGVSLALQREKFIHIKTTFHGPRDDSTITSDGDERLRLRALVNPLYLPNNISVLVVKILCRSDRLKVISPDVEYSNITLRITDGNQMRLLFGEHTRSNTIIPLEVSLGESRVLQCPESQDTGLEFLILRDVDVVLTITNGD